MTFLLAFLVTLLVPDSPDTLYRQPQLAADARMAVLAFGAGDGVYFAASADHGKTFSAPVKVAAAGKLALGRHRGPRIALTARAIVITAIAGEKGGGADGDLLAWRSTDGGRRWSGPARVNDVPAAAREGLHAMAASGDTLFTVWLDLRSKGTKLYGSVSRDGGAAWSPNVLVYASPSGAVCECCHPTALVDAAGRIAVLFRNSLDGARDMYVVESLDGGRTFGPARRQGSGTWALNACPMDGGGMAAEPGGALVTVWRRQREVYLVRAGEEEKLIGQGKDPAVAISGTAAYVLWAAPEGVRAVAPGQAGARTLDPEGAYPQVIAVPGGPVLGAWERQGNIVVERLSPAR